MAKAKRPVKSKSSKAKGSEGQRAQASAEAEAEPVESPRSGGEQLFMTDLQHMTIQALRETAKGEGLTGEDLGFVMDVPVEVTVEIGRKKMRIADVLKIGPGTVLELDKASGESLDILVNNRLLARGEAVVVGERYGVRLTEVVSLVGKVTERS